MRRTKLEKFEVVKPETEALNHRAVAERLGVSEDTAKGICREAGGRLVGRTGWWTTWRAVLRWLEGGK